MEYQKVANLLVVTPDKTSRFITEKLIEVRNQSGNAEIDINQANKYHLKLQC